MYGIYNTCSRNNEYLLTFLIEKNFAQHSFLLVFNNEERRCERHSTITPPIARFRVQLVYHIYMIIAPYIPDHNQVGNKLTSEAKIGRKMVAVAVFEVTSVKVVIITHTMITIA